MSMMMMIVGGRAGSGPGVHVRRILSDPRSQSSVAPREGNLHSTLEGSSMGQTLARRFFFNSWLWIRIVRWENPLMIEKENTEVEEGPCVVPPKKYVVGYI